MIEFKNAIVTITIDQEVGCIHQKWVDFGSTQLFKEAWQHSLAIAKKHRMKHWLIDHTLFKGVAPEDLKWAAEEWLPLSIQQLGVERYVALILSKNIFAEVSFKNEMKKTNKRVANPKMQEAYFTTVEDGKAWLMEKKCTHPS